MSASAAAGTSGSDGMDHGPVSTVSCVTDVPEDHIMTSVAAPRDKPIIDISHFSHSIVAERRVTNS